LIRALFIALEFPPLSQTGVHRSARFVKYLSEFGVEPLVVTLAAADAARAFSAPLDDALSADIPDGTRVLRLACPLPRVPNGRIARAARHYLRVVEDLAARVRPDLEARLPAFVAAHRPDVVYVSMPPFSAGPLAAEVARRFSLPLVVDMRDGWSHWCSGAFPSYLHFRAVLHRERRLFEAAHTVVTVTEQLAGMFRQAHPGLPTTRVQVVTNGFDGALPPWMPSRTHADPSAPFVVGYSGRYYYAPEARAIANTPWWKRAGHRKIHYQPAHEDWLYRSPWFFFRALAALRRIDPETGRRVRYQHVGTIPSWWDAMVSEHGLSDAVHCVGRVPLAEAQRLSAAVDANLCTSVKVVGGEDYALASKTFDYLLGGRPVFGLVTRGAQREFLRRAGVAVLADPDDLQGSVEALRVLVRGEAHLSRDDAYLSGFSRRNTAGALARVLMEAAAARR